MIIDFKLLNAILRHIQVKIWFQNRRMKWRQEIKMKDRGLVPTNKARKAEDAKASESDDASVEANSEPVVINVE